MTSQQKSVHLYKHKMSRSLLQLPGVSTKIVQIQTLSVSCIVVLNGLFQIRDCFITSQSKR